MIDHKTAAWLGEHIPTRINITLYGASEESYEKLCGNGDAYRKVRNAVQWLKEYHVPVKFNTSITPYNVQDLKAMIQYAKSAGSPIQVASYMFPPVRRDNSMVGKNDRLSPEEAGLTRVKADFWQNDPQWFRGMAERFRHFVPLEDCTFEPQEGRKMRMSCRAGHCSFWLDWQGNMMNCGMYGSAKLPLEGRRLGDVWKELREQTHSIRYAPVCASCPNQPLCHSCIAMVRNECGATDGRPEYICRMNQAAAKYYQEYTKFLPKETEEIRTLPEISGCGQDEF